MASASPQLSKSSFLRGWQCPKSLYFSAFEPDVPGSLPPGQAALMDAGRRVGLLARRLFRGGEAVVSVDSTSAAARTRILAAGGAPAIFEALLDSGDGLRAAVDILARGRRGWRLIEVKSSTSVKDEHLPDVAFQLHVARAAGLDVESVEVLHLNSDYVRRGDLDLPALFRSEEVTDQAEALLGEVADVAVRLRRMLQAGGRPEIDIGPHCRRPRDCDCLDVCWQDVPAGSVMEIAHLTWEKKFHLYDQGIRLIDQVPPDLPMPADSRRHVTAVQAGAPLIDRAGLRAFLGELAFPIFLLDFETVAPAIPLWDGTRPYQQVPFQYSLHVLRAVEAEPEHSGFLAEAGPDPRPALLASLLPATAASGSILAFHMPFELGVLRRLAEAFPDVGGEIEMRLPRMEDLIRPFRRWHYWLPEMGGSFSIKSVAPALAPDLSYAQLEIADGLAAARAFEGLLAAPSAEAAARLRSALEAYCKMDTLAMVRVLQAIWREAGGSSAPQTGDQS